MGCEMEREEGRGQSQKGGGNKRRGKEEWMKGRLRNEREIER